VAPGPTRPSALVGDRFGHPQVRPAGLRRGGRGGRGGLRWQGRGPGIVEDGTVEVPAAPERAGWFRLGTVPGYRGSAVILGHVDSVDGPAVFADLSTMRSPDRVQVVLSDDTLVTFEVTSVETYANADFPAERVYAGTSRVAALNLVTCGGEYDRERGGYQSNVVVYTRRTRL